MINFETTVTWENPAMLIELLKKPGENYFEVEGQDDKVVKVKAKVGKGAWQSFI